MQRKSYVICELTYEEHGKTSELGDIKWKENGKLNFNYRWHPTEIIRLAAVIIKTRTYFDVILLCIQGRITITTNGVFSKI